MHGRSRHHWLWIAAAIALIGLLLVPSWIGERKTEAEFMAEAKAQGWVKIGSFGGHWPAQVERKVEGQDEVRFVREDGTAHHYRGFEGYRLQAVFLRDREGKETIVVLRSAERQEAATAPRPEVEEQGVRRE